MILDLSDGSESIQHIKKGYVVPAGLDINKRLQASGVLDSNREFVENSISWSSSTLPVNSAPTIGEDADIVQLSGKYIFGGTLYGHFGHFIVESLARIWAADQVEDIKGIIFVSKTSNIPEKSVLKLQHLGSILGAPAPFIVADKTLQVEDLYVPSQGFGMNDLSSGSLAFRNYINKFAGRDIKAEGPEKVYISRSKLPTMRGSILGETKMEEYLEAEGYEIFHPQLHSPEVQIATYKAARKIISVDCSPLHLLGYVGNQDQTLGIITRRSMSVGKYLLDQLRTFKNIDAFETSHILDDWMPQPGSRPSRSSYGEVDFAAICADLKAKGLIGEAADWNNLTPEERDAELKAQEARHETAFKSFQKKQ